MSAHRLVIVDDHPLFRDALSQALSAGNEAIEIVSVGSLDELTAALAANSDLDLVLLDLSMPGVQGFSGLLYLRAQHPEIPVVIVSANDDPLVIRRAIDFGASGFVPKSQPTVVINEAVHKVLAGEIWMPEGVGDAPADDETAELVKRLSTLTPQQVRVLMMLGEGLLNKQIAYELGVSARRRSRRTSRPFCRSSASTAGPRRSSRSTRSTPPNGKAKRSRSFPI